MTALAIVVAFILGFLFGVWERRQDGLVVDRETLLSAPARVRETMIKTVGTKGEVLLTPDPAEFKREEDEDFQRKLHGTV